MNHIKIYLGEIGKNVNPLDMTKADIEQYLHVSREKLVYIKSPLDYLDPDI